MEGCLIPFPMYSITEIHFGSCATVTTTTEDDTYTERLGDEVNQFITFLDDLNYQGYARHLAEEQPSAYIREFNEFLDNYFLPY